MKSNRIKISLLLIVAVAVSGCGAQKDETTPEKNLSQNTKVSIVATLFPQYDFARIIGGEKTEVTLILPPGTEAHSYDPTPQDMVKMLESDIFIYTGEIMEPWTTNIVSNLVFEKVKVLDLSENIILLKVEDEHRGEEENEEDHDEVIGYDPHYWTDPNMAMIMVDSIRDALVDSDAINAAHYNENANELKNQLRQLDIDIKGMLLHTESKTILSGGHFAFGYFAVQYGLDHLSPYTGFSPNAEPTPQRITALMEIIEKTEAKAIFFEELIDPKVAEIIVEETGIDMLLLHGIHNISKEDLESGKSYIDFMYENLENLKVGLGYNG